MRTALLVLCWGFTLAACQQKKKVSLSGDEPVAIGDFIGFFQPLTLPYTYSDSSLARKEKDSLRISYKVFTQFVPDSVLKKQFGKNTKPVIYGLGKVEAPGAETYLLVKTVQNTRRALYWLAFDKKEQFVAALPALQVDGNPATVQTVTMDRRFTLTKTVLRRNRDGSFSEGKDVFVLNEAAQRFTLIMTDALEDRPTELINPIDTLPRRHKWSGDYKAGKMNLVSVRDGRKPDRATIFIHIEKDNGACTGELKGEAFWQGPNKAVYRLEGDPCILTIQFSPGSLSLREEEGCGLHRSLKCSFNGSFARQKNPKPPASRSAKRPRKG